MNCIIMSTHSGNLISFGKWLLIRKLFHQISTLQQQLRWLHRCTMCKTKSHVKYRKQTLTWISINKCRPMNLLHKKKHILLLCFQESFIAFDYYACVSPFDCFFFSEYHVTFVWWSIEPQTLFGHRFSMFGGHLNFSRWWLYWHEYKYQI